jgi:hypothetical protein
MRCIHEVGVVCARQTTCPAVALEQPLVDAVPPTAMPLGQSVLEVRAHRTHAAMSNGAVQHLIQGSESSPLEAGTAAVVLHTFCRFRDAFVKWNATAHRISALCNTADTSETNWQTTREINTRKECQRWRWFLGNESEKVVRHSATDHELAATGGTTIETSYAGEDVTALADALAQLPSSSSHPHSDAHEALLTVLLRTTRGAGHQTLVDELDVADVAGRAAAIVSQDAMSAKAAVEDYRRWHSREVTQVEQDVMKAAYLGDVAAVVVKQPHWGCQRVEYPLVRVAVVGEFHQGSWYNRVQRFIDSMCTYCRSTPFLVRLQPFLQRAAGIQTSEADGELFRRARSYRESLEWSPDVVIINLGAMDAKLGGVDVNGVSKELTVLLSAYSELASRPEIFVILPHQIFDIETEPGRRHPRTKRFFIGPVARRLYDVVVPGVVDAVRRWQRDEEERIQKVRLVDFHRVHLRWLRRMVHLANATGGAAFVPLRDEVRHDPLELFPIEAPAAQQTLLRLIPDGVTFDKSTNKLLGAVMFRALLQRTHK